MLIEPDKPPKSMHKASAICILLSPKTGVKSTDRLHRVRHYTRTLIPDSNSDEITGPNSFLPGDLIAGLVFVSKDLALAIIQVTSLERDKRQVSRLTIGDLSQKDSKITLTGQVLQLQKAGMKWLWTGSYEQMPLTGIVKEKASCKSLVLKFDGNLIQVISPSILDTCLSLHALTSGAVSKLTKTWSFDHSELEFMYDSLIDHARVAGGYGNIAKVVAPMKSFPYTQENGINIASD